MKKSTTIKIITILMLIEPISVLAHPGRTDSNGCHTCKTNCENYGLNYGEYHCHNGNKVSNINPETVETSKEQNTYKNETTPANTTTTKKTTPKQPTTKIAVTTTEPAKNNDTSIKLILIDNKSFETIEDITYITRQNKVNIDVILNDKKATFKIEDNENLKPGMNIVKIIVTAEDSSKEIYNILVKKEEELSSNKEVKIIIDKEEVIFDNYKGKIYVSSSTIKPTIDYKLMDQRSKIEIEELQNIKTGENKINFKVIAEDNSEQEYEITIYKYSKIEEIIYTILSLSIISGIVYGVYFVIKKIKRK